MPQPADEIALELPVDPALIGVARLVVGGLGARLDLPFEALDDLQLVIETVLSAEAAPGVAGPQSRINVVARVADSQIDLDVYPVSLDLGAAASGGASAGLTVDQICSSLADSHAVLEEAGIRRLKLEKAIPAPEPSHGP